MLVTATHIDVLTQLQVVRRADMLKFHAWHNRGSLPACLSMHLTCCAVTPNTLCVSCTCYGVAVVIVAKSVALNLLLLLCVYFCLHVAC